MEERGESYLREEAGARKVRNAIRRGGESKGGGGATLLVRKGQSYGEVKTASGTSIRLKSRHRCGKRKSKARL